MHNSTQAIALANLTSALAGALVTGSAEGVYAGSDAGSNDAANNFFYNYRPLDDDLWITPDKPEDLKPEGFGGNSNQDMMHEHGFYEDAQGGNIGFGNNGIFTETEQRLLDSYQEPNQNTIHYDDAVMREAIAIVNSTGNYEAKDYKFCTHNCQDWADATRTQYNRMLGRLPEQKGSMQSFRQLPPDTLDTVYRNQQIQNFQLRFKDYD